MQAVKRFGVVVLLVTLGLASGAHAADTTIDLPSNDGTDSFQVRATDVTDPANTVTSPVFGVQSNGEISVGALLLRAGTTTWSISARDSGEAGAGSLVIGPVAADGAASVSLVLTPGGDVYLPLGSIILGNATGCAKVTVGPFNPQSQWVGTNAFTVPCPQY